MNDYLSKLNPKHHDGIIAKMLEQAENEQIPIIREDAIHLLLQMIKIAKVKKVLEIGTAIGYSAIMIAMHTEASVTTIERDPHLFHQACDHVKEANLSDRIKLLHGDALEINIEEEASYDLLFIDAAKAAYVSLFERYEPYLKKGGLLITDNLLFHGIVTDPKKASSRNVRQLVRKIDQFNQFLMQRQDYDSYIYDIGDGMSISIKR